MIPSDEPLTVVRAHHHLTRGPQAGPALLTAGLLFAASGTLFLAGQAGRFDWRSVRSMSEHWNASAWHAVTWVLVNGTAALAAVVGTRGALTLGEDMRCDRERWWPWVSALAVAGYGLVAVANVADVLWVRRAARDFAQVGPLTQAAMEAAGPATLDPTLAWRFLTLGAWMALISRAAWRRKRLSRVVGGAGTVAGTFGFVFGLGQLASWWQVPLAGAAIAVVVHPVWLVAAGRELRGRSAGEPAVAGAGAARRDGK